MVEMICPMSIKLQIEIQGETIQAKDIKAYRGWSHVDPGQEFQTQGSSFTYDELRGLGNGKHLVKANGLPEKVDRDSGGCQ